MSRNIALPAALLAALLFATPASARSFTVSAAGNSPSVAVDGGGTTHIVWDTVDDATKTSTTHYCKVLRSGKACAAGTERTFAPAMGDRDFAGPRVYLPGGGRVVVVTSRCCSSLDGPDGQSHGTQVIRFLSSDGGGAFDAGAWIGGTQTPDVGAAFAPGDVFLAFGISAGGTGVAASPITGFTGPTNTITPILALSGGIGVGATSTIAAFNDRNSVYWAKLAGDPNAPGAWGTPAKLATGDDTQVTSGPKGPDVFYKVGESHARYVVRRLTAAGTGFGKAVTVSESGYPIFGNVAQDPAGRIHAAWVGRYGLTYRESSTSGRSFGKLRALAKGTRYFHLVLAADIKGRATVAFDGNGDASRVGGYTIG